MTVGMPGSRRIDDERSTALKIRDITSCRTNMQGKQPLSLVTLTTVSFFEEHASASSVEEGDEPNTLQVNLKLKISPVLPWGRVVTIPILDR